MFWLLYHSLHQWNRTECIMIVTVYLYPPPFSLSLFLHPLILKFIIKNTVYNTNWTLLTKHHIHSTCVPLMHSPTMYSGGNTVYMYVHVYCTYIYTFCIHVTTIWIHNIFIVLSFNLWESNHRNSSTDCNNNIVVVPIKCTLHVALHKIIIVRLILAEVHVYIPYMYYL